MSKDAILTPEGLEKLKAELIELKEKGRKEVIERIRNAKEFGDLSENAEYEDAKNQQSFVEGRIQELDETIKHAKIISKSADKSVVNVGDKVVIDCGEGRESYEIVGVNESDPLSGKISVESPIANAIVGKKVGEVITVPTPDGERKCKILVIN